MTSSYNIDFNELHNTTGRISSDVRILDKQTVVIMRCGAAQKTAWDLYRSKHWHFLSSVATTRTAAKRLIFFVQRLA
jgi:hypothetical protein